MSRFHLIVFTLLTAFWLSACGSSVPGVNASSVDELSLEQIKSGLNRKTGHQLKLYEGEYYGRALGQKASKVLGISSMSSLCEQVGHNPPSTAIDCNTEFGILLFEKGYNQKDLDDAVKTAKTMPRRTPPSELIDKIPLFNDAAKILKKKFWGEIVSR